MKSFLEEYGFAILAAIVVIILIAMCTPVGNIIKNNIKELVGDFSGRADNKQIDAFNAGDVEVTLVQIDEKRLRVKVKSQSTTDEFLVQWRSRPKKGEWSVWINFQGRIADNRGLIHIGTTDENTPIELTNGQEVQVRVKDYGKNNDIWFESNVITWGKNIEAE